MRRTLLSIPAIAFALCQSLAAAATGHIQVYCEPAVQVFVDAAFKGITNLDEGGKVISDISTGPHRLKLLKAGHVAQESIIEVKPDSVSEYRATKFIAKNGDTIPTPAMEVPRTNPMPETNDLAGRGIAPKMGDGWLLAHSNINLVSIKPGTYIAGSSIKSLFYKAANPHQVTLTKPFWISRTEITQAQWTKVMGNNPSWVIADELPMLGDREQALAFCLTLTSQERAAGRLPDGFVYTLPTEAQWEYASRAGASAEPTEADLDAIAWYKKNSGKQLHPVATKQPNAWGIHDMLGNAWEWCLDGYGPDEYNNVVDPINPVGAQELFTLRGGQYDLGPEWCRVGVRHPSASAFKTTKKYPGYGFRIVLVKSP